MIQIPALEWWQSLLAIIGALGLSPAPWIIALLTGKLRHERDVIRAELRADKAEATKDAAVQRLAELTGEFGESTVKLLQALPKPKGGQS